MIYLHNEVNVVVHALVFCKNFVKIYGFIEPYKVI